MRYNLAQFPRTDLSEDHDDDEGDAAYGDDGAGGGGLRQILGDLAVDVQPLDVHHHSGSGTAGKLMSMFTRCL